MLHRVAVVFLLLLHCQLYGITVDSVNCDVAVVGLGSSSGLDKKLTARVCRDVKVVVRADASISESMAVKANPPFYSFTIPVVSQDGQVVAQSRTATYYKNGSKPILLENNIVGEPVLPGQSGPSEIQNVICQVKAGSRTGKDSLSISALIDSDNVDIQTLLMSEYLTLQMAGQEWKLPLSGFSVKKDILGYRGKGLIFSYDLLSGKLNFSARGLNLTGYLADDYVFTLGYGQSIFQGKAQLDGDLPIKLIFGYADALTLDKISYSRSSFRHSYKRVRCSGSISAVDFNQQMEPGQLTVRLGSFSQTITGLEKAEGKNIYTYKKDILYQIVAWDYLDRIPVGMEVASASFNFDESRFDLVLEIFAGEKGLNQIVITDNYEPLVLDGEFGLSFGNFNQEIRFTKSGSVVKSGNLKYYEADQWRQELIDENLELAMFKYSTYGNSLYHGEQFLCSHFEEELNRSCNFVYNTPFWSDFCHSLGGQVEANSARSNVFHVTKDQTSDIYYASKFQSGILKLDSLTWDVPVEKVAVECEFSWPDTRYLEWDSDNNVYFYNDLLCTYNTQSTITEPVDMISINAVLPGYADDDLTLVKVPMSDDKFSCLLLLGQEGKAVYELENRLADLPEMLQALTDQDVSLLIPEIHISQIDRDVSVEDTDSDYTFYNEVFEKTSSFNMTSSNVSGSISDSVSCDYEFGVDHKLYDDYYSSVKVTNIIGDNGGYQEVLILCQSIIEAKYTKYCPVIFMIMSNKTGEIILTGRQVYMVNNKYYKYNYDTSEYQPYDGEVVIINEVHDN
ncbi:MAG: hypothetical protein JW745_08090 [Sedimentisphaerales bacterium]|nr:hypothetical protein [Sedimentisphaerales bacterium]MBN2843862.1 hypothetical protein [Sedimentisphaerales bacterium]